VKNGSVESVARHGLEISGVDVLVALAVAPVDIGGTYLVSRHHRSNVARPWDVGASAL